MTQRERMHAAYRGERPDRLPWLVNMDHWYNVNKAQGTLAERYRDWPLWEIQRDLRVSIWQRCGVVRSTSAAEGVTRREESREGGMRYLIETPLGTLTEEYTIAPDFTRARFRTKWLVASPQELRAAAASECPFLQVGGNITAAVVSPRLFARYAMPFFRQVTDLLHAGGKHAQYHFDGWVRPLLPMIAESGLDCIEALTPQPSGDVTLAEAIAALQGKVLIQGGMPAALVTHGFDQEECGRYALETIRIAKTGRVALGMGDNVPPDGDLERVRLITRLVEEQGWL